MSASERRGAWRILVPLVKGQTARPLISVGDALVAGAVEAAGLVLGIVETSFTNPMQGPDIDRIRDMLKWIASSDYDHEGRPAMGVEVRFSTDIAASIRAAVMEHSCSTVVLAYPWLAEPRQHRLRAVCESLLEPAPSDLLLVRPALAAPEAAINPRSIMVAVRGGPHQALINRLIKGFARVAESKVTLVHVSRPSDHQDRRRRGREELQRLATSLGGIPVSIVTAEHANPMSVIMDVAADHDLVVVGSHLDREAPARILSPALRQLLSRSPATVVLAHAAGAQDWQLPEVRSASGASGSRSPRAGVPSVG
ncbi:MAG TPA: universal stress protein [Candidatus Nitrosotalea sp.]|nr:universal stress protein [Candidatus Nitrosotalea sp.]